MNDCIFAIALRKVDDSVAQLVEHLTFNQGVLGSTPSGITLFFYYSKEVNRICS